MEDPPPAADRAALALLRRPGKGRFPWGGGRAGKVANRGFYFDFLEFKSEQAQWMTPSTPSIGHIHALESKLDEIPVLTVVPAG